MALTCLDTSIAISLIAGRDHIVGERFRAALPQGIVLPSTALFELWFGVANSEQKKQNEKRLNAFLLGPIQIVPFGPDDAREAGEIRSQLKRAGTPIGPYDLLIAAQARWRGATLATLNAREFARVPTLAVDDWSS